MKKMNRATRGMMLAAVIALTLCAAPVQSQESVAAYPTKSIRVVVGYPPGTGTDLITRMVGERFQQKWGHGFVVDNRAGASGHIATEAAFKAPPDGYTLLAVPPAFATTPHMFATLPFDPDAFVPKTGTANSGSLRSVVRALRVG